MVYKIGVGQIRKYLEVIDEWIYGIMTTVVPLSVMRQIMEKLQEEELRQIENE